MSAGTPSIYVKPDGCGYQQLRRPTASRARDLQKFRPLLSRMQPAAPGACFGIGHHAWRARHYYLASVLLDGNCTVGAAVAKAVPYPAGAVAFTVEAPIMPTRTAW